MESHAFTTPSGITKGGDLWRERRHDNKPGMGLPMAIIWRPTPMYEGTGQVPGTCVHECTRTFPKSLCASPTWFVATEPRCIDGRPGSATCVETCIPSTSAFKWPECPSCVFGKSTDGGASVNSGGMLPAKFLATTRRLVMALFGASLLARNTNLTDKRLPVLFWRCTAAAWGPVHADGTGLVIGG